MHTFSGKCPYCASDRGFQTFGVSSLKAFDYKKAAEKFFPAILDKWRNQYSDNPLGRFSLAGTCLSCHMPVVAHVLAGTMERQEIINHLNNPDRVCNPPIEQIEIFPKPQMPYKPLGIKNEKVADAFIEAQNLLAMNVNPHLVLMACRVILENALAELGKTENENLYKAIERLRKDGKITEELFQWANIIRNPGNKGAHEIGGNPEEAREMIEFVKIFLLYVFELPARIQEMQRK